MKKLIIAFLIMPLFLSSCKKCGEDVFLGDYPLLEQSKQDWYPYLGVEKLIFENADGDIIELVGSNRTEQFETITFRDICKGNKPGDFAQEVYRAERFVVEYNGLADDKTYFLKIGMLVNRYAIAGNTEYFNLYDEVNFSSSMQNYSTGDNQRIVSNIKLVANPRDTGIENTDIWQDGEAQYSGQLTLNGKSFSNVWYYESNGTASLYIQKGAGIIAFLGFDDQIWVKK